MSTEFKKAVGKLAEEQLRETRKTL